VIHLIVTENSTLKADFSVNDEAIYIGSRPGCKVFLNDLRVGKQHCVIFPDPKSGWVIEHLEEGRYTRVNGVVISHRQELRSGDIITIQDYAIEVRLMGKSPDSSATGIAEAPHIEPQALPTGSIVHKLDDPIQLTRGRLDQLRQIGLGFNKTATLPELTDLTLMTLLQVFKGYRAWMGLFGAGAPATFSEGRDMTGRPIETPSLIASLRSRCVDRSQHIAIPAVGDGRTGSAMAVPLIGPGGKLGMIYVDNRPGTAAFTEQDVGFLVALSAIISVHIEATAHKQARLASEVHSAELVIAKKIRARLLPGAHPEWDTLRVVRLAEDGETGVSDLYDVVKLANKSAAMILVQAEAPLDQTVQMLAQVRSTFRVTSLHADPPHVQMRALNWLLHNPAEHPLLHACAVQINPVSGELAYSTAGSPNLFIFDRQGTPRELNPPKTLPVGSNRTTEFTTLHDRLDPGQTLVMFTEGATAIVNANRLVLGRSALLDMLSDVCGQPVTPAISELASDLYEFMKDGQHPKDMTILLVGREG